MDLEYLMRHSMSSYKGGERASWLIFLEYIWELFFLSLKAWPIVVGWQKLERLDWESIVSIGELEYKCSLGR